MTISAGSRIGPYEILGRLGAGGMGEVWRARDPRLDRDVAVKALPEEVADDAARLARFAAEARAASALNHPNIVTIHEVGQDAAGPYIVMELVEGRTLRELLLGGALPVRRVLEIASPLADALARAHERGIVHRDLKPENVMISRDGLVKILDFGLARADAGAPETAGREDQTLTDGARGIAGTAAYMSPEQASGQTLDGRSDQFALGALLYEALSGRRAFRRGSRAETLAAVIREDPEPLSASCDRVPIPLRWIVERCLSKDPGDRYASTRDLARDLKSVRDHYALSDSGSDTAPLLWTPEPRHKGARPARMAIAFALFAAAGWFFGVRARGRVRRPSQARMPRRFRGSQA
jgi:eukaryotic-like serine/threonine-protein kinase